MTTFISDLKKKDFIPLKVIEFVSQAALFSFYPFMSIFARDVGITGSQYGIISLIVPFFVIIVPAVVGMIADKIGNFKWFLSITIFLNGVSALLYLSIPRMETRILTVNTTSVEFHCNLVDSSYIHRESSAFYYNEAHGTSNQCIYNCILIREPEISMKRMTTTNSLCKIKKDCDMNVRMGESEVYGEYILEAEARRHNSTHYLVDTDECIDNLGMESTDNETIVDTSCLFPCAGDLAAFNTTKEEVITDYNIIVVYTVFKIINTMFIAGSLPLMMTAVVSVLREKQGDLGYQKVYGKLGAIIFSPLTGALIDYSSTDDNQNYSPSFYIYFILNCFGAASMLFVDLEFKPESKAVIKEVKQQLRKIEITVLLITCIIIGIAYGVLDTFFFWLLEDLGADKGLMGITVTVGAVSGLIISLFSTKIIGKFGCSDCISFAIAIFVVRLIGYSLITNPWWSLPFEFLECFTISLLNIAVMTHASVICSVTTMATIQSLLMGAIHGVGRGFGSLIGGFVIGSLGIKASFRIMAVLCAITCIFYTFINKVMIKKTVTSLNQTDYNSEDENTLKN